MKKYILLKVLILLCLLIWFQKMVMFGRNSILCTNFSKILRENNYIKEIKSCLQQNGID
jgi:hypothetical protein